VESHGRRHRDGGHLLRLRVLATAAALDDGAQVVEDVAPGLAVLQPVPRDLLEGVVEEALEDVVHDQVAARCPPVPLVTGPFPGIPPQSFPHPQTQPCS